MTVRAFPHSIIYTYTHIYTQVRIKVLTVIVYITRALCCRNILLQALNLLTIATGINKISTEIRKNPSPHNKIEGDGFFSKQLRLDDISLGNSVPIPVRSWHCRTLERKKKREWIVKCSGDAVPEPRYGWVCDCGRWTWGDDRGHTPIFSRVSELVVAGRRKKECRKY